MVSAFLDGQRAERRRVERRRFFLESLNGGRLADRVSRGSVKTDYIG
jgi:hypothetical protein